MLVDHPDSCLLRQPAGGEFRRAWTPLILVLASFFVVANPIVEGQEKPPVNRQIYELQIWHVSNAENRNQLLAFLENQSLPALARYGINNVGVFTDLEDEDDHNIFVLIPFDSIEQFSGLSDHLLQDEPYQQALTEIGQQELDKPLFARIETRLLRAFAGMPILELPPMSIDKSGRMFELRLYESHTRDHARRKVQMFNDEEIQLMKDVEMGPVFFAETIVGQDKPNLVYMLSASDSEEHNAHWQAFLNDPRWPEMRDKPEYKDTVSKIRSWKLTPADFSGI